MAAERIVFPCVWLPDGYALLGAIFAGRVGNGDSMFGGQYIFARADSVNTPFRCRVERLASCGGTTAAVSILVGDYVVALFPVLHNQSIKIALFLTLALPCFMARRQLGQPDSNSTVR